MADGAIDAYLDTVYKNFKIQPTFPPGALVEVGWIGKIQQGQFVRTSELADHGVRFGKRTVEAPPMRFASAGGVKFTSTVGGELSKAVSAIAKADAGLKIAFTKDSAIALVLDPVTETMIRNVDAIQRWMEGAGRHVLTDDHVIVTHVRHAKSGVIAMAESAGAEVQLKTDTSLGRGQIALGSVAGNFQFVTSSSTEFVSVASKRGGLTPFYRVLYYKDDRRIVDKFLGIEKPKSSTFPSRRLLRYVSNDIAQFPYDKDFLDEGKV